MRRSQALPIVLSAAVLIAGAVGLAPAAQASISAYNIDVKVDVVRAGAAIPVVVSGLYSASRCTLTVVGAGKSKPVSAPVRNYKAAGRLKAPAGPVGEYRVRAACGKDGTATSDPFQVVGASSPLKATCEVVESGFTVKTNQTVTVGAVVRNSSPDLAATSVQLAVSFRDAAGTVVATTTLYPSDIPGGGTVLIGRSSETAPGTASISIASVCETASGPVISPVMGAGAAGVADRWGDTPVSGSFPNPLNTNVANSSRADFVLRNSAGQIIGGGWSYLDAFIPPGGTGTWSTYMFDFNAPVASVQSMLTPRPMS